MAHLFLLSPTTGGTEGSLAEAAALSLNFAFVTPLLLPTVAPILHPGLEGVFQIVVSWALLLVGFISDDGMGSEHSDDHARYVPSAPFLVGAAFLTNILYLPYLALRRPQTDGPVHVPKYRARTLLRVAESHLLPVAAVALFATAALWALFARPEFGGLAERWVSFRDLVDTDILAHSFAVDCGVFALFQAWLVPDDAHRRKWESDRRDAAVAAAAFIPFFGLAWYLWVRAADAPILSESDDEEAKARD